MDSELEKVEQIISKSGHNLNFEIAKLLREKGWKVEVSQYYVDDLTDKPREVDIIASQTIFFGSDLGVYFDQSIPNCCEVLLFIECKYLTEPIVFWMDKRDDRKTKEALQMVGLHKEQILRLATAPSGPELRYFTMDKVGKLVDSKDSKNIFDVATTSIKSLIFNRDHGKKRGVYFPIVVYDGPAHLFTQEKKRQNWVILETNYSYRNPSGEAKGPEAFYIDFVPKDQFEKFLEILKKDVAGIEHIEKQEYQEYKDAMEDRRRGAGSR